jgi:hypothetical protein
MGLSDALGQMLQKVTGGTASEAELHSAFDQVAGAVPQGTLADGIAHVFKSDQTPPFEQMLGGLFQQSAPEQKAGLLNQVLGALGPGAAQTLGETGALAGLAGLLKGGGQVTPQQAQQVSPEQVQVLAQQASQKSPSIVDAAAGFYAQHPALVKSVGAGALALLMSRISSSRR